MELFNTPISSPILIALTVVYAVCAAITTFDTRIIQAKKNGFLGKDEAQVPEWTGLFGILMWLVWIGVFLLNWKYALIIFGVKFILKLLPVLENLGALLLRPVVGKETASAVNVMGREQNKAAHTLKKLEKAKSPEEFKDILHNKKPG